MKKKALITILLGIASALIAAIIFSIIVGKEKRQSIRSTSDVQHFLFCVSSSPIKPFFAKNEYIYDVKYEYKFIYIDDQLGNAFFSYNAKAQSEKDAEQEVALMRSKYYKKMGDIGLDMGALTPSFNYYENSFSVGLYFDNKYLESDIDEILSISIPEGEKVAKLSIDKLKEIYIANNYSCKINDFNN